MTTFEFVASCVGLHEYYLEICDQWEKNFELDEAGISEEDVKYALEGWSYGETMESYIFDYYAELVHTKIQGEYEGTAHEKVVYDFLDKKFDVWINGRDTDIYLDGNTIYDLADAIRIIDEFIENYKLITGKEETNE